MLSESRNEEAMNKYMLERFNVLTASANEKVARQRGPRITSGASGLTQQRFVLFVASFWLGTRQKLSDYN